MYIIITTACVQFSRKYVNDLSIQRPFTTWVQSLEEKCIKIERASSNSVPMYSLTVGVTVEKLCLLQGFKSARLSINGDPEVGRQPKTYSILVKHCLHFIESGLHLGDHGAEIFKNPDRKKIPIALVWDVPVFLRPLQHCLLLCIYVEVDYKQLRFLRWFRSQAAMCVVQFQVRIQQCSTSNFAEQCSHEKASIISFHSLRKACHSEVLSFGAGNQVFYNKLQFFVRLGSGLEPGVATSRFRVDIPSEWALRDISIPEMVAECEATVSAIDLVLLWRVKLNTVVQTYLQ